MSFNKTYSDGQESMRPQINKLVEQLNTINDSYRGLDFKYKALVKAVISNNKGRCSHFTVEVGGGVSILQCIVCNKITQAIG